VRQGTTDRSTTTDREPSAKTSGSCYCGLIELKRAVPHRGKWLPFWLFKPINHHAQSMNF
jgi:hypothetical protein